MYCTKCHTENERKYCPECGTKLIEHITLDAEACNVMGDAYYYGREGRDVDTAEAIRWYRHAASMGHSAALYSLGYCYYQGIGVKKNEGKAVRYFRQAAQQELIDAQNLLGECNDCSVEEEAETAVELYLKATVRKHAKTQYSLGYLYYTANAYEEAIKWLSQAGEQGHAEAQWLVGTLHEQGMGTPKNEEEAKRWYRLAAAQGHKKAIAAIDHV